MAFKFASAVLVLMLAGAASAAPKCRTSDIEGRLVNALKPLAGRADFAGVSIAAGMGDTYRWVHSVGAADVEQRVPMTPATKVRIGSVSKLLTTAALVRLASRGVLDLDAPVQRYLTDWPRHEGPPITARLLAGHLAGIRHYVRSDIKVGTQTSWEEANIRSFRTVDEAIHIFRNDNLLSTPGTTYSYSSYGWTLLSGAMERAAGKPFLDLMQQEVIIPLGLKETQPDHVYDIVPDRAAPYEVSNGRLRIAPQTDRSYVWAGGGYLSTARDLVDFAIAHRPGDYFSQADLKLLFTRQHLSNGQQAPYGVGWHLSLQEWLEHPDWARSESWDAFVAGMKKAPPTAWHSGGAPGGSSLMLFDPAGQVSVATVSNVVDDDIELILTMEALTFYRRLTERFRSCRKS
jgi:serine beta-lactamase-like protein LACTB